MLVLLDTGPAQPLERCEFELGLPVGQLLTPLTRYRRQDVRRPWAIDNGAFSNFNEKAYFSLIARESVFVECLFVAAPDVVGNAEATMELFWKYFRDLKGLPIALVLQDGQELVPIPWHLLKAVFVGGSNDFKLSKLSLGLCSEAKRLGKWVHMGRVNSPDRLHSAIFANVDSIDGTGISRYTWMRERLRESFRQERMFQ